MSLQILEERSVSYVTQLTMSLRRPGRERDYWVIYLSQILLLIWRKRIGLETRPAGNYHIRTFQWIVWRPRCIQLASSSREYWQASWIPSAMLSGEGTHTLQLRNLRTCSERHTHILHSLCTVVREKQACILYPFAILLLEGSTYFPSLLQYFLGDASMLHRQLFI